MALTIQAVVSLDTQMFTAGIRGIEAQVNRFAGLAMMQFGGLAQQIAAMWGAFGPAGAAVSALGAVVQAGAGYEQQMMRVASYTQAAGETMERLSSEGAQMAATFGFSLDQVGTSMASLALAGVDAADMGDVLQASLLLASATLGDANQSAELITSTLKIFQADMAKATSVADLFAGAIASSPLDLQRLSDSMKYAGSTGSAFGMSMEQVVSEIAAFHQVGLRGQMAGTAFRGALLEMSDASAKAKGVVGSALQGWVPATEGLTGAVRRLNAAGVDASDVIQELGKRAGPGVAALMQLGADAMEDLTGKIRENSSVSSMHEKQMEALAGQYKLLQGEISELAKKIFDALAPGFKSALAQVKDSVAKFAEFASVLKGPVSAAFNTLFPHIVKATTLLLTFNATLKGLSFLGINAGATTFGGIINKAVGNIRAARQEVATLTAANKQLEASISTLNIRKATLKLQLDNLAKKYKGAELTAEQYSVQCGALGGQMSGLSGKIKKAEASIAANNAKLKEATALSKSWHGGLGPLGASISAVGAALAGWQIGKLVADLRVWGTDNTVHEWLSLFIANLTGAKVAMADITGEISHELTELQQNIKTWKEDGQKAFDKWAEGLANDEYHLRALSGAMEEVQQEASALAAELAAAFDFSPDNGFDGAGILVQLREMARIAEELGNDLPEAFDPAPVKEMQAAISDLEGKAAQLKQSLVQKQEEYVAALRQEKTVTVEIADWTSRLAVLEKQRKHAHGGEITALNTQIGLVREKLEALKKVAAANEEAKDAAKKALDEESGKLEDTRNQLDEKRRGLRSIIATVEELREVQQNANAAWEEWQAEEKIRETTEALEALADAFAATDLSMEDAKVGIKALGNGMDYFVGVAEKAGIKSKQVGKNIQWMAKNQDEARIILERLGVKTEEVTRFMVMYGEKAYAVARAMSQLGLSEEEAARHVEVFGAAAKETNQTIAENTKVIAANRKELMALASISGTRMERLVANLKKLREALTPPAGAQAIDLSWMRDLSALKRLPNLGNVDSWLKKFSDFANGIRDICQNLGPNIDFSWVDPVAKFQLPKLDDSSGWIKNFKNWAASVRAETPSLERFATVLQSLQGSLAALNDATLKIVFKDEALLSRIESHLSTLAGLKGVIWA